MPTNEQIQQALTQVIDPELSRNVVELGMVRDICIEGADVHITLALTIVGCPLRNYLREQTQNAAASVPGVENVTVELTTMTEGERRRVTDYMSPAAHFNQIGRVIAVMSGKGGVGKSSVTALLATALQRQGFSAGVLDADLTGPSIPRLFGVSGPVQGIPFGILPIHTRTGIKVMSTNLMLEDENLAIIWRGPIMSGTIRQFWGDVLWGQVDTLLVDLPPGTSDATLTVMQSLPLNGVILVTTPQSLSAMVVRKTVDLSQHMRVPILGIVENMAYFPCPESGVRHEIFGPSHAEEISQASGAPILGRLPVDPELMRMADAGEIEGYEHPAFTSLASAFLQAVPAAEPAAASRPASSSNLE